MPPRYSMRSATGSQTPEPAEPAREDRTSLLTPNLPALRATSSSRHQYSYGAAEEPPLARHGLRRRRIRDLSTIVRDTLAKQKGKPRLFSSQTQSEDGDGDEDELAQPANGASRTGGARGADDVRSFDLEDDYYGDAIIASSTGDMLPPSSMAPRRAQPAFEKQFRLESRIKKPVSQDYEETEPSKSTDTWRIDKTSMPTVDTAFGMSPLPKQKRAAPVSPPEVDTKTRHEEWASPTQHSRFLAENGESDGSTVSASWLGSINKATTIFPSILQRGTQGLMADAYGHKDSDLEDEPAINWWQLLNPWTYVKATIWVIGEAWLRSVEVLSLYASLFKKRVMPHPFQSLLYAFGCMVTLFLALATSSAAKTWLGRDTVDDLWVPVSESAKWYSPVEVGRKMGHLLPPVGRTSRDRWNEIKDLWKMDDVQRDRMEDYVKKMEQAFDVLKSVTKLHDASLKKLEAVVPRVVHMQTRDGKPVVAPEFWHALRDLIHEDGAFMTFEKKRGEYEMSSEQQWQAIALRLADDATLTQKLNVTVREAEDRLNSRLTLWESWVEANDAKVKQGLESALETAKAATSSGEWNARIGNMVEEQVRDYASQGVFVRRDEYLRHVQDELSTYLGHFRAELAELRPQLEQLVRDSVELVSKEASPAGLGRKEMTRLVNELVRKAVADMNLEVLAEDKIHAHWNTELRNQVNYFSVSAGAIIGPVYTTPTHDAHGNGNYNPVDDSKGLRARHPPKAALTAWNDDGDCWCTAARARDRNGKRHGATLSVQLAHRVIPQHLVMEHILPGATTEPGTRPRDVELYADIEDVQVRERLRDFAVAHFPDDDGPDDGPDDSPDKGSGDSSSRPLPPSFVKLGQFVYRGAEARAGVHVHRLSPDLVALGADTDHVVVRATSNYGGLNHTCFYRLRLYGLKVDGVGDLSGGDVHDHDHGA